MTQQVNIYLVDDHQSVNDGLESYINANTPYKVTKKMSSGEEALEAVRFAPPTLLIADIRMNGMDGLELTHRLKKEVPAVKVLILSMHNSGAYVKEAIQAGADGYIPKDSKMDEVIRAIEALCKGQTYISPSLAITLHKAQQNDVYITEREKQVLVQIAEGLNTEQIADKLFISFNTVETHRKNLLNKTDSSNVVELLRWGVEHGYVKL